jgi:hypothetical protein
MTTNSRFAPARLLADACTQRVPAGHQRTARRGGVDAGGEFDVAQFGALHRHPRGACAGHGERAQTQCDGRDPESPTLRRDQRDALRVERVGTVLRLAGCRIEFRTERGDALGQRALGRGAGFRLRVTAHFRDQLRPALREFRRRTRDREATVVDRVHRRDATLLECVDHCACRA